MQIDLSVIPNPRKREKRAKYVFMDIVIIMILSVICGADTGLAMSIFARSKRELLNKFLSVPDQMPSHDTFSHMLQVIDPVQFALVLSQFKELISDISKNLGKQPVLAMDGKILRRSYKDSKDFCKAPLMVSVFATDSSLVLGSKLAENNNESLGADELLKLLDIKGCIVTADAAHSRKTLIKIIDEKDADYCICVKKNQLKAWRYIDTTLSKTQPTSQYYQKDSGHGRNEERTIKIYRVPSDESMFAVWHGLAGIAIYETTRCVKKTGKVTHNRRFFFLSNLWEAKFVHDLIRSHWRIETGLHGVLDIHLGEDYSRCRNKNAPQNLAILKRLAISIIKAAQNKGSVKGQMMNAGWNDDFLINLVSFA